MWFKNMQIFKFIEPFTLDTGELNKLLEAHQYLTCRSVDAMTQGFVPPNGVEGELVYSANGYLMFCLQREEKIVPGSVVKQRLDEKVAEIEKAQGRKVRKREKENLKEDIHHELIMRAFSKTKKTYGYIDTIDGYLVVDASNHSKAEEFSVALRGALGSLKIEIPKVQSLTILLTEWLKKNDYPAEFTINDQASFRDPKENGEYRCKKVNLFAEEVQSILQSGGMVTQLSMSFSEQVSFNLKDDFSLKSIKFLEMIQDQSRDVVAETAAARFDADFLIMAETFRGLIRELIKHFGSEQ